jgi:drug/metabolite transporter (DMT)-like permease
MMRSSILLLVAAALGAACGQLLFRVGAQNKGTLLEFANPQIFAGLLLYGISTALWIYTLSREKLVVVYAFTVLTFVLVYLGSVVFLGETLSQRAVLGVVLVLGGLYLLAA